MTSKAGKTSCSSLAVELTEADLNLVRSEANRLMSPDVVWWDMLYDAGVDALLHSRRKFNPKRGGSVSYYTRRLVRWRMLKALAEIERKIEAIHRMGETLAEARERRDQIDPFGERARILALAEKDPVLREIYIKGLRQVDLARREGVTEGTISHRVSYALGRLERKLHQEDRYKKWV